MCSSSLLCGDGDGGSEAVGCQKSHTAAELTYDVGDVTCDAADVSFQLLPREAGHVSSQREADQVDVVQRSAVSAGPGGQVSVTYSTGSQADGGTRGPRGQTQDQRLTGVREHNSLQHHYPDCQECAEIAPCCTSSHSHTMGSAEQPTIPANHDRNTTYVGTASQL